MKMYKEVIIESEEQALSLPVGTIITWNHIDHPDVLMVAVKHADDEVAQIGTHFVSEVTEFVSDDVETFTALVAEEAEECIGSEMSHRISDERHDIHVLPAGTIEQAHWQIENNPDYATGRIMKRYRTPWKEIHEDV